MGINMNVIEVTKQLNVCFAQFKPDGLKGIIELVSNAISKEDNITGSFLVFQRALIHLNNNEEVKKKYDNALVAETMETLPAFCVRRINETQGIKITRVPMGSSSVNIIKKINN